MCFAAHQHRAQEVPGRASMLAVVGMRCEDGLARKPLLENPIRLLCVRPRRAAQAGPGRCTCGTMQYTRGSSWTWPAVCATTGAPWGRSASARAVSSAAAATSRSAASTSPTQTPVKPSAPSSAGWRHGHDQDTTSVHRKEVQMQNQWNRWGWHSWKGHRRGKRHLGGRRGGWGGWGGGFR